MFRTLANACATVITNATGCCTRKQHAYCVVALTRALEACNEVCTLFLCIVFMYFFTGKFRQGYLPPSFFKNQFYRFIRVFLLQVDSLLNHREDSNGMEIVYQKKEEVWVMRRYKDTQGEGPILKADSLGSYLTLMLNISAPETIAETLSTVFWWKTIPTKR